MSEPKREKAVEMLAAALTEAGVSSPSVKAAGIVDALNEHHVEVFKALMNAEERLETKR